MKKKIDMGKSIVIGIVSFFVFSAAFTGCGKNYDYEISALVKRTDSLIQQINNDIAALQTRLGGMLTITSVVSISDGFRLTLSDGTSYSITSGTPGTVWTIGPTIPTGTYLDSLWYKDDNPTEHRAIPKDGAPGTPGTSGTATPVRSPRVNPDTNCWEYYEWNASTSAFDVIPTNYNVGGILVSYVTEDPNDPNQWILNVKNAAGTGWEVITLPKTPISSSAAAGSIGLIGHVDAVNPPNISLTTAWADIVIPYWYIDSVFNVTENTRRSSWTSKKHLYEGQVVSLLEKNNVHLVITADPALTSDNMQDVVFKNSKGAALPLALGTPSLYNGLLTKADGGTVYLAPLSVDDQTYTTKTDFSSKFNANAVYYLEDTERGVKSNYSSFSFIAVDSSARVIPEAAITAISGLGASGSGSAFSVKAGERNTFLFDSASKLYDYEIDDQGSEPVDVYNEDGFFIIQLAGIYELVVKKLHIDGKIYNDTITVTAAI
jgi:hypothetical protein